MDHLINTSIALTAFFQDFAGLGVTGLTVTIDIYNSSNVLVVDNQACTPLAGGGYGYDYTPTALGRYWGKFKTAVTTVAQQELPFAFFVVSASAGTLDAKIDVIDGNVDDIETALGSLTIDLSPVIEDTEAIQAALVVLDGKADDIIEDIYDLTHIDDTPISRVIPPPTTANSCVIYEYCFDQTGGAPLSSVTATAKITELPYDYNDLLYTGASVAGTYVAATGLLTWEIVQGATVTVSIPALGMTKSIVIPSATEARISDIASAI